MRLTIAFFIAAVCAAMISCSNDVSRKIKNQPDTLANTDSDTLLAGDADELPGEDGTLSDNAETEGALPDATVDGEPGETDPWQDIEPLQDIEETDEDPVFEIDPGYDTEMPDDVEWDFTPQNDDTPVTDWPIPQDRDQLKPDNRPDADGFRPDADQVVYPDTQPADYDAVHPDTFIPDNFIPDTAQPDIDTVKPDTSKPDTSIDVDSVIPDVDAVKPDTNPNDNTITPDTTIPDKDAAIDTDFPKDTDMVPDADFPADACLQHVDCPFGYKCDTAANPNACVSASSCKSDVDCKWYETCEMAENWKECKLNSGQTKCSTDADCQKGEKCEALFGTYKVCRSYNKCTTDDECAANQVCEWTGTYFDCVTVCTVDKDCGFGYKCTKATPHNTCDYASECASDADCSSFQTCEASGNWNVCKLGGGFCTSDANCKADEYCDISVGFFGSCKSRNQCTVDADCGENMACVSNGTYNECKPKQTQQCILDLQCPDGWTCKDYQCTPKYAGTCSEIEGLWTVWISTSLFFTNGSAYEFIPKNGCSGDVKKDGGSIPSGTFAQNTSGDFDLKMALLFNCTAKITANMVMQVTCSNGTATLGRK